MFSNSSSQSHLSEKKHCIELILIPQTHSVSQNLRKQDPSLYEASISHLQHTVTLAENIKKTQPTFDVSKYSKLHTEAVKRHLLSTSSSEQKINKTASSLSPKSEALNVQTHNVEQEKILSTQLVISIISQGKPTILATLDKFNLETQEELYQLRKELGKDCFTKKDVIRKYEDEPVYLIQQNWLRRNPSAIQKIADILKISKDDFLKQAQIKDVSAQSNCPPLELPGMRK